MTDDELYRQYLAGERAAFDELILRYSDMLTAYVNAFLHNAQDAEDVMLDSFAAIVLNKPEIAEGRFRAYLFKPHGTRQTACGGFASGGRSSAWTSRRRKPSPPRCPSRRPQYCKPSAAPSCSAA